MLTKYDLAHLDELEALADRCIAHARASKPFATASGARSNKRSGSTINAAAKWQAAVADAMVEAKGDRQRAVAIVARRNPQLRADLVAQANSQPATARRQPRPQARQVGSSMFNQQLEKLVEGGMPRQQAIRQLSKDLGLSDSGSTGFWQAGRQSYRQ